MKSSARALQECRDRGWLSGLVEKPWNPHSGRREDFLGIIDIIALDGKPGSLGIQACGSDVQEHVRKITESTTVVPWLAAGNRLELWSFRKLKYARGSKAVRWKLRALRCRLNELTQHPIWEDL